MGKVMNKSAIPFFMFGLLPALLIAFSCSQQKHPYYIQQQIDKGTIHIGMTQDELYRLTGGCGSESSRITEDDRVTFCSFQTSDIPSGRDDGMAYSGPRTTIVISKGKVVSIEWE